MKTSELFEKIDKEVKYYVPKLNVYLRDHGLDETEIKETIGMLRGLANAIDGFKTISGIDNESAINEKRVTFIFADVEGAHRFKECIDKYFSEDILNKFKAKKVTVKL